MVIQRHGSASGSSCFSERTGQAQGTCAKALTQGPPAWPAGRVEQGRLIGGSDIYTGLEGWEELELLTCGS